MVSTVGLLVTSSDSQTLPGEQLFPRQAILSVLIWSYRVSRQARGKDRRRPRLLQKNGCSRRSYPGKQRAESRTEEQKKK